MSGQGRTLAVLGGVLAAGIAAVVWLTAGGGPADDGDRDAPSAVAPGAAAHPAAPGAARAKKKGTAGVFGEIRRTAGKAPVPGQEVRLTPARGEAYAMTTDATGAFRFSGVPHGETFELSAAAPGCGTIRIPGIALDRNEQRNVGTLWLDPSVPLLVRVRTSADEPVEGAVVLAYPNPKWVDYDWSKAFAQMAVEPVSVASATSDAKGEAHFPQMAVGGWTLVASKPPLAKGAARGVTLRSGETAEPVTIRLGAGHALDGRVRTAAGAPVKDALVMAAEVDSAWDTDAAPLRARTKTDDEGRYALTMLDAGDVQLWVAHGGGAPAPLATVRIPLIAHYDLVLHETGILAGRVTAKDGGAPIEGVTVRVSSWEATTTCAETVTGSDGRYSLALPEGPVNELVAEKDGLVQVRPETNLGTQRQAVVREGATTTRDIVMTRGSRLTGVVRCEEGPLPGARVLAHIGSENAGFTQVPAISGADGRYEFTSLEASRVLVLVEKEGYFLEGAPDEWWNAAQSQDAASEFRVTIPESGEATRDFTLKRGSLVTGLVTGPGGEPLAGARVSTPSAAESAPTGADGVFRLEGVKPSATVALECRRTGYVPAAPVQIAVAADTPTETVTIRMVREPVVRGRVTSATGQTPADVRVAAACVNSGGDRAPWDEIWRWAHATRLAVRGGGAFEGPAPYMPGQSLVLRASAAGLAETETKPVAFIEGQDVYEIDIVLSEGADLDGIVRTKSGAPLAGAEVSIARQFVPDQEGATYSWSGGPGASVFAVSGADGRFRVPHVAPGNYDVRASARGFVDAQATVAVGTAPPVTLELSPELTIEGTVLLADGTPVEGLDVAVEGNGVGRVEFGGLSEDATAATTDARGAFRVTHIAEGTYALSVSVPWGAAINVRPKRVEGIAAGTKSVKIVLDAGGEIRGRVTDSRGKPVAGAAVSATPMKQADGGWESHDAETRADGSFALLGLGSGPQRISARAQDAAGGGFRLARLDDVAVGRKDLVIVLEDGLEITGVVLDANAKPVPNLQLEASRTDGEGDEDDSSDLDGDTYARTDSEGRFQLQGLLPGAYRIGVAQWGDPNGGLILDANDTVDAGSRDVRLVARRGGVISGVAVDEAGKALAGVWISAHDKVGQQFPRNARSKPDGSFEVSGLPGEGPFTVTAQSPGRVQVRVEGVQAGARELKFTMLRGLEASGRVSDSAGNPVRNASVILSRAEGRPSTVVQTGADGRFTATGLEAGTYQVSVVLRGADGTGETKPCGEIRAGDMNVELRAQ